MTGEKFMQEILDRYRKVIITAAGVIVFLVAGMMTMIFTDSGNEPSTQLQQSQNQTASSEPTAPESNQPSKILYVYITGEIRKPGVYKLSEDARIFQLVEMAGGFTPKADTVSLNLAGTLTDGSHIHIGAKPQTPQQSPTIPGMPANFQETQHYAAAENTAHSSRSRQSASHIQSSSGGIIDINTANSQELESLPGIGPALAKRIIGYRNEHGNFARPEDLVNVKGIGQSKLAQILPRVTAMNTGHHATRIIQPQSSFGKIDINTATQKQLEQLKGVGKVTAKRIIEYRQTHGRFTKPEDLINIKGISSAKLENMRSQIIIR